MKSRLRTKCLLCRKWIAVGDDIKRHPNQHSSWVHVNCTQVKKPESAKLATQAPSYEWLED